MSIERVKGKNVVVFIYDGGVWKLYACGRSCTLDVVTDFVETSISGQGKFATFTPTKHSFTGTLTGVMMIQKSGMLGLAELRAFQLAQTKLLMRFQRTSDNGGVYTDEASFFISNSNDEGSYDNIATYTIQLRGTGVITQVFTVAPSLLTSQDMRYEYTGVGGETTITVPTIIGKYILVVNKDGLGNSKIITTGTPVAKEVKYTTATGVFEWAIPFEAGEQAYIIYREI